MNLQNTENNKEVMTEMDVLNAFGEFSFINLQDMKLWLEDESTNKQGTKIKTRCVNRRKAFTTPIKKKFIRTTCKLKCKNKADYLLNTIQRRAVKKAEEDLFFCV